MPRAACISARFLANANQGPRPRQRQEGVGEQGALQALSGAAARERKEAGCDIPQCNPDSAHRVARDGATAQISPMRSQTGRQRTVPRFDVDGSAGALQMRPWPRARLCCCLNGLGAMERAAGWGLGAGRGQRRLVRPSKELHTARRHPNSHRCLCQTADLTAATVLQKEMVLSQARCTRANMRRW